VFDGRPNGLQRNYVLSDSPAQLKVVPRIHGASAFRRRCAFGGIAAYSQGVAGGPAEKFFHVLVLDQNLEMGHAIGALSPQGCEEAVFVRFTGKRFDT
jgi:hypothetical protein